MMQNAAMVQKSVLILGIGNPLRGDDGAGWVLAERLAAAWPRFTGLVSLRRVQQLTPELAEEIAELGPKLVIFADAAAENQTAAVKVLRREEAVELGGSEWGSSHALGAAQLMEMTRRLYNFDCDAWLVTVPGVEFGHGEGLSTVAEAGIEGALRLVKGELDG